MLRVYAIKLMKKFKMLNTLMNDNVSAGNLQTYDRKGVEDEEHYLERQRNWLGSEKSGAVLSWPYMIQITKMISK